MVEDKFNIFSFFGQGTGPPQSRAIQVIKIPLNLPLQKGDFNYPSLEKGVTEDFKKEPIFKTDSTK